MREEASLTELSSMSTEDLMKMRPQITSSQVMSLFKGGKPVDDYPVLASPIARAGLGAYQAFMAPIQLGANVGEKLADISGATDLSRLVKKKLGIHTGGKPLLSAGGLNQTLGGLEAAKRQAMAARSGRPVGEEWDIAGLLGSLYPGTMAYKSIAGALPKVISEQAPSLTGRTVGRMLTGGGTAALTIPVTSGGEDFFNEKGIQTGIGAAVPVAASTLISLLKGTGKIGGKIYSTLRDAARLHTKTGPQKIAEAHFQSIAKEGGEEATGKTVKSLLQAEKILNKPTSAEAIAAGNIAKGERFGGPVVRLQEELASLPETTTKLRSIEAAQEQIRKGAIENIAKGTSAESALLERTIAAAKNYDKAFYRTIDGKKIPHTATPDRELQTIFDKFGNDTPKILGRAKDLAVKDGKQFKIGAKYPIESLHFTKMALDDVIKNPEQFGIGASEARALARTQGELVKWIGAKSKAYDFARQEHKRLSEILNRTKARDTLANILTGPKGEERATQFLNATRDIPKTFKKATGSQRYAKLEDILLPNETMLVNKVTRELEREAMAGRMAKEVNLPGAVNPVTGKMESLPQMLWTPNMIAKWVMRISGREGDKEVNKIAADIAANPSRAAEVISRLPSRLQTMGKNLLSDLDEFLKTEIAKTAAIQGTNRLRE